MLDGISSAASVLTIIHLGAKVCSECQKYYVGVKHARNDIKRLTDEIVALTDVLDGLRATLDVSGLDDTTQNNTTFRIEDLLGKVNGPLSACQQCLENIREKVKERPGIKWKWPFYEKDISRIVQDLERQKSIINLALVVDVKSTTDSIKSTTNSIQSDILVVRQTIENAEIEVQREKILRWLPNADSSSNYNAAREKHDPTTGNWIFQNAKFCEWKTSPNSVLWLHGKAGCGKSILSSAIIHRTKGSLINQEKCAIAYFYFDFGDLGKQTASSFIGSICLQLYRQRSDTPKPLIDVFEYCLKGQDAPSLDALLTIFRACLEGFDQVFVIVDALDESPTLNSCRSSVLKAITKIREMKNSCVHILVTSRKEMDIEAEICRNSIAEVGALSVDIETELVDRDISQFIENQLQTSAFDTWPISLKTEAKEQLRLKADGTFRYVALQLERVSTLKQPKLIKKALKSLPESLDETYDRMLSNIEAENIYQVHSILQLIAFADRPLELKELADAAVVDLREDPSFDPDNRFLNVSDVLRLLPGLVVATERPARDSEFPFGNAFLPHYLESLEDFVTKPVIEVKFAHFSVKEYLMSKRIASREGPQLQIVEDKAHYFIAEVCLSYFTQVADSMSIDSNLVTQYPFLVYSAHHWSSHFLKSDDASRSSRMKSLCTRLFSSNEELFVNWIRLSDPDGRLKTMQSRPLSHASGKYDVKRWYYSIGKSTRDKISSRLYYASFIGLADIVADLLIDHASSNADRYDLSLPLHGASFCGHLAIVEFLLEQGADVDTSTNDFRSAVEAASAHGHIPIIRLLLRQGASIDLLDSGLMEAVASSQVQVVKLLLAAGVDVNAKDIFDSSALNEAASCGSTEIVELLMKYGADIDDSSGFGCSPLASASSIGNMTITQLLLERGADVNGPAGIHPSALHAASSYGHVDVAQLLIKHGANVNLQKKQSDLTPLVQAVENLEVEAVKLLLDNGAFVNTGVEDYTAIDVAVVARDTDDYNVLTRQKAKQIVGLLEENGAVVSTPNLYRWTEMTRRSWM